MVREISLATEFLYNVEIGDNLVAAAPDDVIQSSNIFQEYAERVVGVAKYQNYFNAGILLMNLDEMRKFDFILKNKGIFKWIFGDN